MAGKQAARPLALLICILAITLQVPAKATTFFPDGQLSGKVSIATSKDGATASSATLQFVAQVSSAAPSNADNIDGVQRFIKLVNIKGCNSDGSVAGPAASVLNCNLFTSSCFKEVFGTAKLGFYQAPSGQVDPANMVLMPDDADSFSSMWALQATLAMNPNVLASCSDFWPTPGADSDPTALLAAVARTVAELSSVMKLIATEFDTR